MMGSRLLAGGALALALAAFSPVAQAACVVSAPTDTVSSFANNLSVMTADRVKLKGGCIDNIPIGQNQPAPGNFTSLSINGVQVCVNESGVLQLCTVPPGTTTPLTADDGTTPLTADDGTTPLTFGTVSSLGSDMTADNSTTLLTADDGATPLTAQ